MSLDWSSVTVEVWLASAYCLVLVGLAYLIDMLARRAASTAEGGATSGFRYHADHDAWKCPQDQWLWPQSFDPENRVMRYRGSPSICNSCPVKASCTPSPSGREVHRAVDAWPASEAARFHRSIACSVVVLGLTWPLALAVTGAGRAGGLVLAVAVVLAIAASLPLWSHLRRSPVFLPPGLATLTLDASLAEREAAAATWQSRRSIYRSDRLGNKDVIK